MKQVKKVFNVEYDLTSEEFKAQKQDEVSEKYQNTYKEYIVKVTTFCAKDKQIVIHTTQETSDLMGTGSKELAQRHMKEQSFLTMDDDMTKTYEINVMLDSDLPDYETVLNIAQSKANEMFEKDDSKIPLVTVIDYKWKNPPTTISASLFSEIDEEGNILSLINPQAYANVAIADAEAGDAYTKGLFVNTDGLTYDINKDIDGDFKVSFKFTTFNIGNDYPILFGTHNGWGTGSWGIRYNDINNGSHALAICRYGDNDVLVIDDIPFDTEIFVEVERKNNILSMKAYDKEVSTQDNYLIEFKTRETRVGNGNLVRNDGKTNCECEIREFKFSY